MSFTRSLIVAVPLMAASVSDAGASAAPADLVLTGGNVRTGEAERPRASALAVRGGRIVALGSEAEVRKLVGPKTQVLALAGATVLPGLTDAHVHVEGLGTALVSLSLVGAQNLREALDRVGARARSLAPGEWLIGRGWDQNDWPEARFPSAADLDSVSGGHPVYLVRVDGHAAWVNTPALRAGGVTASTPDPDGGRILRDAAGAPAGVLVDAAQALVQRHIPPPSKAVRKRRLARGMQAAADAGLTSVHDAGVTLDTVALYKELLAEGAMPVRVYVMVRGPQEFLRAGPSLRPEVGLGDGLLTVRAIKVVADGALGSRGALLSAPYSDEPGTKGLLTVEVEAFRELLTRALAQGFQVNTHAIGDAANRLVLDAYEWAFGPAGGAAHRWRVEHAQVVSPADVPRFKALGVIPSVQPTHCTSDMYWATARLGEERAEGAYRWRSFLDQGLVLAGGSDAPVEDIAVVPGLFAAITRQDARGWPEGGWHPGERVSAEEALRMFGRGAAYAAFEEGERGTVAVGRRADLTVLDRDPLAVPAAELLGARVVHTLVGGRVVSGPAAGQ